MGEVPLDKVLFQSCGYSKSESSCTFFNPQVMHDEKFMNQISAVIRKRAKIPSRKMGRKGDTGEWKILSKLQSIICEECRK